MSGWLRQSECLAVGVLLVATCWTGIAADRDGTAQQAGQQQFSEQALRIAQAETKVDAADREVRIRIARENLQEAHEALREKQLTEARAGAEKALEALGNAAEDQEEQRTLRLEALGIVRSATFFADRERWREATHEALQVNEQLGDQEQTAELVYQLALHDGQLSQDERDRLEWRAMQLFRELGRYRRLAEALFFRGWHQIARGHFDAGFQTLDEAREAINGEPYTAMHACLDASSEFQGIAGGELDTDRKVQWGAGCHIVKAQDQRLVYLSQPGFSTSNATREEKAKFRDAFGMLFQTRWLPYTGPEPGYEEQISTFSYTGNPTQTRVWIETDDASVTTPAGVFEGCLLVRAETTESSLDAEDESHQRTLNQIWCGQHYCWLARGVGPVAYRHERADGIVVHALLSGFECPEKREEWVPLIVGTRWEYVPAEAGADFDALVLCRLTHIDQDGNAYIAYTCVGNRTR